MLLTTASLAFLGDSEIQLGSHSNACTTLLPTGSSGFSHTVLACGPGSWWEVALCGLQLVSLYFHLLFISLFILSNHLPIV